MGSGILDPWGLWESGQRLSVPDLGFPLFVFSAIINPKQSKDAPKSFTFDYSYWSHTSVRLLGLEEEPSRRRRGAGVGGGIWVLRRGPIAGK